MAVLIKYRGIITVINKLFKICDLAKQVEKTCPIDEGNHQVTVTETFPSYAPSVSVLIIIQLLYYPDSRLVSYETVVFFLK